MKSKNIESKQTQNTRGEPKNTMEQRNAKITK
jgi:hypothetical protein